ncbi:hypothetical protein A9Y57_01969 [Streptococcus parauberis]|uniref:PTS fructose transporter subunit IA n=1 Tax=Streptococcus parauberis TaxID=1348 RepID=A0A854WJK1_9STRE|nr:PTS fructose transporter subunit IA [Streptococcus parauberis]PCH10679.1 hypothetical protein A9Y57_01969 [Streptococcus parauberis]
MTDKNVVKGYETEISYQKHMIENLERWFSTLLLTSSVAVALLFILLHQNSIFKVIEIVLLLISVLGMIVIGRGIYNGKRNINMIITEFEKKLSV